MIGLIRVGISLFVDSDLQLRYSILVFDGFFLFLSALALIKHFNCVRDIQTGWLFLIYPFLMFGCYRPTASFNGLVSYGAKTNKSVVFAMAAYNITLCLIARPDKYRLFLPFLPLILWVFEDYRQKGVTS